MPIRLRTSAQRAACRVVGVACANADHASASGRAAHAVPSTSAGCALNTGANPRKRGALASAIGALAAATAAETGCAADGAAGDGATAGGPAADGALARVAARGVAIAEASAMRET
ncbi:hypothetical protein C1X73_32890, partial [Pseudomonas sp. FW305-130]